MKKKQSTFFFLLINSWIILPAIIYFQKINKYSVNLPYLDDYDAIIAFLNKFVTVGFKEKIFLLFSQQNEHRIFLSRVIFFIYYKLFGTINFQDLILIGNLFLVGIFFILIHFIRKVITKHWNIAAFILALCIFDLSNFENADSSMASISNYGIIFLFLLGILFYSKKNNYYIIPAILLQAIIVFSSGNGIIASAFIVLYTLILKDKKRIISSIACFLIFAPLYFLHYDKPSSTQTSPIEICIKYFFQQTGSVYNFEYSLLIGIIVIVLIILTLPISKNIKIKDKNNIAPLIVLLLFILASMSTIALFRSSFKGVYFYTSRYLIYPHLLTAILFVFGFLKLNEKGIKWPIIITFILIMFSVYKNNSEWGESGFNVENTRLITTNFVYPDQERAKVLTDEACRLNIYCIDEAR